MNVGVRVDRMLDHGAIVLFGAFDLRHATEVVAAIQSAQADLSECHSADVSLAQINRIDGTGALLLVRLLDHLAANGCRTAIAAGDNPEASRLIDLYRRHRVAFSPPSVTHLKSPY